MKIFAKCLTPAVLLLLVMFAALEAGAADTPAKTGTAPALSDGTFTVVSLEGDKLIFKLEKDSILSGVELAAGSERIKAAGFSNLDDSMQITADGYLYKAGRIQCTFKPPDGFKPDKLYITGKKDSEPAEFDLSGLK